MFIAQKDGTVYFLTEIRLCCLCCRMFDRNVTSHNIVIRDRFILFAHMVCPSQKESYEKRAKSA